MKRGKPPLTIHKKCIKKLNPWISGASHDDKCVKSEIRVFSQKVDMPEKCDEMDVNTNKKLILNSSNSFRSADNHSLFLRDNENYASELDDSTSQHNLGREWGEDILRSFSLLDHENIEQFGKGSNSLTPYKESIQGSRSSLLISKQSARVPTSFIKTRKTYRTISILQQRQKSISSILASKKIKIAYKRLRMTGKIRSLRFFKDKQNSRNNADVSIHLERSVKNRNSCSNSKIKNNESKVEDYSRDEENSGHLLSENKIELNQYQRRRGNAESLNRYKARNNVTSGLTHSLTAACDTKIHCRDANQCFTKNDQETNYNLEDTKSKSPVKSLPTNVNTISSKNVKKSDSNTILTFSIDKNRVSPVGGRSKFSHSQKLLRQSKLFLIKRSARLDQEPPAHSVFSVNRELAPNVENEYLKRRSEELPFPTKHMRTKCESELDPPATIINSEEDRNYSNVSLMEANTKKEKLRNCQQKLSGKSSLQEGIVDVNVFFETNKNILFSFPKVDRMNMKKRGETSNELQHPPSFALPSTAELSCPSRHSTSDMSPKISHNSSSFTKAKRSRSRFHREKLKRKCHDNVSDDCKMHCATSPDSSFGTISTVDVNAECKEVENVRCSKSSVRACSEETRNKPCSYKTERTCCYFLTKKQRRKTESKKLSSTSRSENYEIGPNVHTFKVHGKKDNPYSCRNENVEKREKFDYETAQGDFSIKKFPLNSFLHNNSAEQKHCKNTDISNKVKERAKKKITRKRKLWTQSSSLEDIQTHEVDETCSSRSHEDTCKSHLKSQFQNARNNFCTLQIVDTKKEGNMIEKCGLQHISHSSQREEDNSTTMPKGCKVRLLLQQPDAKETRYVAAEEASPSKTTIKIQEVPIEQNNLNEKDNIQENVFAAQQYSSERNNNSFCLRFCSGKETVEECFSKNKGSLKETLNLSAAGEEYNQTSYSDETNPLTVTPSQIHKGNEKQVSNSNGLNKGQLSPKNILSSVEISPNLLRSISVRPKLINKSSSLASVVKSKNDFSVQKTSVVEENLRPYTQENFKNCQDSSIQLTLGDQIDSEVKGNIQEDIKSNDELSMEIVHPLSKNSKNCVNEEKLLKSPTNMDTVSHSQISPLKEFLQESHNLSQKTTAQGFEIGLITDSYCVSAFSHGSPRSKTLKAKQPSVISTSNFKVASEISVDKDGLSTGCELELLNDTGQNRELVGTSGCTTNTGCAEPVISPSLEKHMHSGSFTVKYVQKMNKSHIDLIQNSLTDAKDENLWTPDSEHDSRKDEKNVLQIMTRQTVSHLPTEIRSKCAKQFNYDGNPAHSLLCNVSESKGNRVSNSRKNGELHDEVICRPDDAENISETLFLDSTTDKTNICNKLALIQRDIMSLPIHNNSIPECNSKENVHNVLCNSSIDSEKINVSHSGIYSMYSDFLENWKREFNVKRRLIFQQNASGVATYETKTSSRTSLNAGSPQDVAFEDSGIPVCEQHNEGDVDSSNHDLTKEGTKTHIITFFPSRRGEKQEEKNICQDSQENTSCVPGKENLTKKQSTSLFTDSFPGGENNENCVKIPNNDNAFKETSKVLRKETQNISCQALPAIEIQGKAGSVSALFKSEINTGEGTILPLLGFTNKCGESLKSPGTTNDSERRTKQLIGEASKDKVWRIARFNSCPNKINRTQQNNYFDCAIISEAADIHNSYTKLANSCQTALGPTTETINCFEEENLHSFKQLERRTENSLKVGEAESVAKIHEHDCTVPFKGKSESTSEVCQREELTSSICDRRSSYLQNKSRASAKAVRNKKLIRKTLRSPYMLRNAIRDENCLSSPSRKKRQHNSKLLVNEFISLHDQAKSVLSHPSLLTELTRIVRSPYLLRNRKIRSQFSFVNHSEKVRTCRRVNLHSGSEPIVKSGSNINGKEVNKRKIRSPYMLRNDKRRKKPCNTSETNKKRKIRTCNKRKSASFYPFSSERHIFSSVLSTLARISRSPHLRRLKGKRLHTKSVSHVSHKREDMVRASSDKIQDEVGNQIASGAQVQKNTAEINLCISMRKEDDNEIVEKNKHSTTSEPFDLDFHILPESSAHEPRSSSEVQKYQRASLSEPTEEASLSSRLPHHTNTMISKGEETLRKSHSLKTSSLDMSSRFPTFTEGRSEKEDNDQNLLRTTVKNTHPKFLIQSEQISSKTSVLDENLSQVCGTSNILLSELVTLKDREILETVEKDHSMFQDRRKDRFQSTTKDVTTKKIGIDCSSSANCEKNCEIPEANKCFKSVEKDNQILPNLYERVQRETPLSSNFSSHPLNYTFSAKEEGRTQYVCSPLLQQCSAGKRVVPSKSITTAQKRLVNNALHSATSAYSNTVFNSNQGSSGSDILEENNAHSFVHSQGRKKIGFQGSLWLNDEIRKLFPLPQCLDESRNRIMSSSTFIWLCSEKKSRELRFPILNKEEKLKSKNVAGKNQRASTLKTNVLGKSQSVSDSGRKEMKPQMNKNNCGENKERVGSTYLPNKRKNSVSVRKLGGNNKKTNAFPTRQELQKRAENSNIEFRSVIKKISFKGYDNLSSSTKHLNSVPNTRKKSRKILLSPVDKGVTRHTVTCKQTSKIKSIKPTCQEKTLEKKNCYARSDPVKVKNLKISKKFHKVEPMVMPNKSDISRRQHTVLNKRKESGNLSEGLHESFESGNERKPKSAGISSSTSSQIAMVTGSLSPIETTANEGGKSDMRSLKWKETDTEYSENSQNAKIHEREEMKCTSFVTDSYQDAVKFLEHMYNISYSAAKMKPKKHVSSSCILTRLINDPNLLGNYYELNNETSTADQRNPKLPAKKTLTIGKRNETTMLMSNGDESEKPEVQSEFTKAVDYSKGTVRKRRKRKSKQEKNTSQDYNLKPSAVRKKINQSLDKRETSPTTQDGKILSSLPSLPRNGTVKGKRQIASRKLQNQEAFLGNSGDSNAMQIRPATCSLAQPKASLSAEDGQDGSQSSDEASLQATGEPMWSPLAFLTSPPPTRLVHGTRRRLQDLALDLSSPDECAIHRAVQRAKRQLASRASPPPPPSAPAPTRATSRVDELARRLWERE